MDPAPDPDLTAAKRAFLDFLRDDDGGDDSVAFERFCGKHPEFEEPLRGFYRFWLEIGRGNPLEATATISRLPAVDLDELPDSDGNLLPMDPTEDGDTNVVFGARKPHYRVRHEIDRGGMGTVFKVRDTNLRRHLALKRINRVNKETGSDKVQDIDARVLSRFFEEAQITGQLNHPGIVPVHELGIDNEQRAYFTMQLVQGRTFAEILDFVRRHERDWNQPRALGVIIKVCETMAYAHAKGVLHRDLKPDNVMVGRFGETYVVDWGLARVIGRDDDKDIRIRGLDQGFSMMETTRNELKEDDPSSPLFTLDGDVVGTPSYMSPEQAAGQIEELSPRSDVYAVGALLYHVLTGHPPYAPPDAVLGNYTILQMVLAGAPTRVLDANPDASDELADICAKAMHREPAQRYANMMEMAADIEAFLGRRPISSRKATLGYVLRLAIERNRPLFATAAAAILIVVAIVVFDAVRIRSARDDAEEARDLAKSAQRVTERMLDFRSGLALLAEADALFPPVPENVAAMREWLSEADQRLVRFDQYQVELSRLDEGDDGLDAKALRAGVDSLTRLRDTVGEVRARLAIAEQLHGRSIRDEQVAWDAAVAAIRASPNYGGLKIEPQLGLVPLGANVQGYYEFWHVLSGQRPQRDAEGHVSPAAADGMVFVLLPAGICRRGSPLDEPQRYASLEVQRAVELVAFFVSKFEVTQAQWERVMGANPSMHGPGTHSVESTSQTSVQEVTALHPVESVAWSQCRELARRLDLRLLFESEWEYACRAGTSGRWSFGDDGRGSESLRVKENLKDLSSSPLAPENGGVNWPDGFPLHAPVGSFAANPFGLFDMHGNVQEWCSDRIRLPNLEVRPIRGGSYFSRVRFTRSASRMMDVARSFNKQLGTRLARAVRR